MVDPNCIKFQDMITSEDGESNVGMIYDNQFYFMNIKTGDRRVSRVDGNDMLNIFIRKAHSCIKLSDVLAAAGFEQYDEARAEQYKEDGIEILDLTDLKKDTLINLFTK